jgi:hypothetical protein
MTVKTVYPEVLKFTVVLDINWLPFIKKTFLELRAFVEIERPKSPKRESFEFVTLSIS